MKIKNNYGGDLDVGKYGGDTREEVDKYAGGVKKKKKWWVEQAENCEDFEGFWD